MLDSIAAIAAIVIPVFSLIGLGFGSAKTGLLKLSVADGLADFVFVIALPLLLFKTIGTADIGGVSPLPFWAAYFGSVGVVWALGAFLVRRVFGRDARVGVIAGVASAFSNIMLVGLPFMISAFGQEAAVPVATLIAIHLPVMMTASTLHVQRAERADGAAGPGMPIGRVLLQVGGNLLRNPLIIGIIAGFLWRPTGIEIHGILATIIDMLTRAAVPTALFALGMSLARYGLSGNVRPAFVMAALKLVALPACVYVAMTTFTDLPPLWVNAGTMAAACPTGVNAWLIAARFGTGLALSANVITMSTAMAVATMTLWLAFLTHV